ncbi:MAG TPA: SurA N-terminal domain-containing protein [Syntrophales bacterium]|nr:SurA N-terminal domain-containing protein [Syntrophales bacterium]
MLELMRKHARHWLMIVLLGMIIFVFVLYFGTTRGRHQAEAIAVIDGKAIPYMEFQRKYQNLVEIYRQQYGGVLTDDILKSLNLKQQAYDDVINQAVILQNAKDLNLQVTEDEVKASIFSNPAFQRAGVFDEKIYNQVLRYNRMAPADFEDAQRMMLAMAKLEDIIQGAVKVSDKEVLDLYRFQSEKINVSYLSLSSKNYKSMVTSRRSDLESYLKEHQDDFLVPEQIQIKYISFSGHDFLSSVNVPETDVVEFYNRHKDNFMKKGGIVAPLSEVKDKIIDELKQGRSKHIAAEEAKKAHDEIYQKENFDNYARQHGYRISTTSLFNSKNTPQEFKQVKDFTKVALSLQTDELSPVLSDDKSYYVLKLVAKKPSYVPVLNEIEKEVENQFVEREAMRLCKKDAEGILESLKKGETLQKISKEKGLKIEETGFFLPGYTIPKIGFSKDLSNDLLQTSDQNPYPDNVHYINGSFIIVKFKERGKLDFHDFDAKKAVLANLLLKMKRSEYMTAWIEKNKESMIKNGRLKLTKDVKEL